MPAATKIDERLAGQLRERGMRVTPQRIVIHRALCGQSQHMTAEQVLTRVSDVLPGTSLPTVYSTLELLEIARADPPRGHRQRRRGVRLPGGAARAHGVPAVRGDGRSRGRRRPDDALARARTPGSCPTTPSSWCGGCAASAPPDHSLTRGSSRGLKQFSDPHLAALLTMADRHRRKRLGGAPPSRAVDEVVLGRRGGPDLRRAGPASTSPT